MAWLQIWLNAVKFCESAAQAHRSYSWETSWKTRVASVCQDTARPGNPGDSCWLEPISKANSWRAQGVCVCMHVCIPPLQQGCRPWGFVFHYASSWGEQLRLQGVEPATGWLLSGTRGIHGIHGCVCLQQVHPDQPEPGRGLGDLCCACMSAVLSASGHSCSVCVCLYACTHYRLGDFLCMSAYWEYMLRLAAGCTLRTWNWTASFLSGQLIQQLLTLEVGRDLPAQSRVNRSRLLFTTWKDETWIICSSVSNSHSTFFSHLQMEFTVFWGVLTAASFTGYHWGVSGSFFTPIRYLYNDKSHPNILLLRLNSPRSFSLSLYVRCSNPI